MRNYLPFPHFFSVPSTAFHPHALFCFPVGNIWVGWRVVTHGVCVCVCDEKPQGFCLQALEDSQR